MKERVVLSLGGSLLFKDGEINKEYIKSIAELIKTSEKTFGIVVGGGIAARLYAKGVRELGLGEFHADNIAIMSTKQNAMLISLVCDGVYVNDFDEALRNKDKKIVVMGGTIPGISTDTDSALLAECLGAKRLINLSSTEGIYDKDPKKYADAKKYDEMDYDELLSLAISSDTREAGMHFVFDLVACTIIKRSKIETHFVNGRNLEEVEKAINGKKHGGTVVRGGE